jgi:hypothetical protein
MSDQFTAIMISHAKRVIRRKGHVTADDLRRYAAKHGIEPRHPNAWGMVFTLAKFTPIGFQVSTWPSSRGRAIRRWAA